jgi:hypothetical protein
VASWAVADTFPAISFVFCVTYNSINGLQIN